VNQVLLKLDLQQGNEVSKLINVLYVPTFALHFSELFSNEVHSLKVWGREGTRWAWGHKWSRYVGILVEV